LAKIKIVLKTHRTAPDLEELTGALEPLQNLGKVVEYRYIGDEKTKRR